MTRLSVKLIVGNAGSEGKAGREGSEMAGNEMDRIEGKVGKAGRDLVIVDKLNFGKWIGRGFSR